MALSMFIPALISLRLNSFISGITTSGGYITYTTTSVHKLTKDDIVTITDATTTGFNLKNATVYDTPTTTSFRVASSVTGSTSTASLTYYLSDHNRAPVQQSYDIIENSKRMADGTMRKYVTATKKSWSVSWEMLPGISSQTVDGYLGAMALQDFYNTNYNNAISLSFYSGSSSTSTQPKVITSQTPSTDTTVFISNFNCTIQKRFGKIDYWNVSMDFVEV